MIAHAHAGISRNRGIPNTYQTSLWDFRKLPIRVKDVRDLRVCKPREFDGLGFRSWGGAQQGIEQLRSIACCRILDLNLRVEELGFVGLLEPWGSSRV